MGVKNLTIGLAATTTFLGLFPGTQALPKWLQPNHGEVDNVKFAPRGYSVYENPPVTYGGYTWAGYGPAPTISSISSSEASTSTNSGEEITVSSVSSIGASISPSSSSSVLKCNHDDCLRQLVRASASAVGFCDTFTATTNTATTGLPSYVSQCKNSPSRISSACSCFQTGSATSSPPVSTSSQNTYSATSGSTKGSFSSPFAQSTSTDGGIATFLPLSTSRITLSSSSSNQGERTITLTSSITETDSTSVSTQSSLNNLRTGSSGILQSSASSSVNYPNSTSSTPVIIFTSTPTITGTVKSLSSSHHQTTHRHSKSKTKTHYSVIPTGTSPYTSGLSSGGISIPSSSSSPPFPLNSTSTASGVIGTSARSTISLTSVVTVTQSASSRSTPIYATGRLSLSTGISSQSSVSGGTFSFPSSNSSSYHISQASTKPITTSANSGAFTSLNSSSAALTSSTLSTPSTFSTATSKDSVIVTSSSSAPPYWIPTTVYETVTVTPTPFGSPHHSEGKHDHQREGEHNHHGGDYGHGDDGGNYNSIGRFW